MVPPWCWAQCWALGYSSEQTRPKPLSNRDCILIWARKGRHIWDSARLQGRDQIYKSEAQGRGLGQSLEFREEWHHCGWDCLREQERPQGPLKVGPNLERPILEGDRKTGNQVTELGWAGRGGVSGGRRAGSQSELGSVLLAFVWV